MTKNTQNYRREKNNFNFKAFWCIFLMLVVLNLNSISALTFDDWKTYDENTKTFKIENFFTLGDTLLEGTLKTPLDNRVGLGYRNLGGNLDVYKCGEESIK